MERLTKRQQQVLDFIIWWQQDQGVLPTLREISAHFGFSSDNAARQHLRLIERKGYLRRTPHKSRHIIPVLGIDVDSHAANQVPIVGRIAAGVPITAVENLEGYVALDNHLFPGGGLFALRVKGDSMKEIGINHGDLVVVKKQQSAVNGDIIAALVKDEATVKRFFRDGNIVRLHPENKAMNDIIIKGPDVSDFSILGKVIGVIRRM